MMWWGYYGNHARALYATNNGTTSGYIDCYAEEDGLYYRGELQVGFNMAFVYFSSNPDRYNWTDDS